MTGATRGEVHMRSMSVIAIVGTVRNTLTNGSKKRRQASLTAASAEKRTAQTNAIAHPSAARSIVYPYDVQK